MFRQLLGDAVNKLCQDSYAVGYVDCDTNYYFDDDFFDYEDVSYVCGEVPCLFLSYNKEKIHVYMRIPKVYDVSSLHFISKKNFF